MLDRRQEVQSNFRETLRQWESWDVGEHTISPMHYNIYSVRNEGGVGGPGPP